MSKSKALGCLALFSFFAAACGPAATGGDSPVNPGADGGAPFEPASDPNPNGGTTGGASPSPARDDASPSGDAAVGDTYTRPASPSGDAAVDPAPSGDAAVASPSGDAAVASPAPVTPPSVDCSALAADLAARDALPESPLAKSSWYTSSMQGTWGPAAAKFPAVAVPSGCDRVTFMRDRVIAAAKHYTGLPYEHHHVPSWAPSSAWSGAEGPGLDCSNFTAWVYNFGLGIGLTSNVVDQANTAGRLLGPSEPLMPGDLLYITTADGSAIAHVVIYVDAGTIIDDTSSAPSVGLRAFTGWYKTRFSHARRVIE